MNAMEGTAVSLTNSILYLVWLAATDKVDAHDTAPLYLWFLLLALGSLLTFFLVVVGAAQEAVRNTVTRRLRAAPLHLEGAGYCLGG
jgi:threonine/homoserine/homoserine lactone efflux protein